MYFIPEYILILFFTIVVDYWAGILIEKSSKGKTAFLIISIIANIGVLTFFKYFNFVNSNIQALADFVGWNYPVENLAWILPIGLSFHTFQALSYTIEVYRGNQKAERHFGIYALYVMFYPQLVAGPIERPQNILHQLKAHHSFDFRRLRDGIILMGWGLFKKVAIADRLAVLVDPVFNNPQDFAGHQMLIATVFFSFQIFCDFSGYSDIALGSAQVLGVKLMANFDRPYSSKSIPEFWSRWHISLSTWFRDYLYIPLGGNRVSLRRWFLNIFIVFVISGLWHGANWTFILWGAIHGAATVGHSFIKKWINKFYTSRSLLWDFLSVVVTFSIVTLAWVFFRADTVGTAFHILSEIFSSGTWSTIVTAIIQFDFTVIDLPFHMPDFITGVILIILMEVIHFLQRKQTIVEWITQRPLFQRWAIYYLLIMGVIVLGKFEANSFIYFQF